MARMEGPVATSMGIVYSCDWEIETGKRILPPPPDVNIMPFEEASGHTIHTIASGPGFPEDLIHQALLTAAYAAKEHLIMTTPYFVPSDDLLHAICTAAQRGVDVSIILPRKNDSLLVGWASRAFFTELLAAGVKIYQFEGGLLHTKSVLVDGELSLVGTVNLDMRSLWLNLRLRWSLMTPVSAAIWRRFRMIISRARACWTPVVVKTSAVAADRRATVLLLQPVAVKRAHQIPNE
jgi:cardiolipin synthase